MIAKIALENFLIIDIETVSAKKEFEELDTDWKHLWEEKVHRSLPNETTADAYYPMRAGVMAEFAKVICISIGYFKKEKGNYQFRVKPFFLNDIALQLGVFTFGAVEAVPYRIDPSEALPFLFP